jgi:hypothetical protein
LKPKAFKVLIFTVLFYILYFIFAASSFSQEQFSYDAKNKRDPFIALVTPDGRLLDLEPVAKASVLLLEGIIYDKNGLSCAVVNGGIVKIGDKVGDYQVLKIEEKRVIFIKDGQPIEAKLGKEEQP